MAKCKNVQNLRIRQLRKEIVAVAKKGGRASLDSSVYRKVVSVDTSRKNVFLVVLLQCDCLKMFGKVRLEEVRNRVPSLDKMFAEQICSRFCEKSCTR